MKNLILAIESSCDDSSPEISEKIDFDFEKMLKKALKPYVQESDIHFIEGQHISELLTDEGGGIHCMCNEIPAKL